MMILSLASSQCADCEEAKVVLITAIGSDVEVISDKDLRRLYLGMKSADNPSIKSAVINHHSAELYDEFLKNIMHMTEAGYKRKLVKAIFRRGKEEIAEVDTFADLLAHLQKNKGDVSFIDFATVKDRDDVEVVQILW